MDFLAIDLTLYNKVYNDTRLDAPKDIRLVHILPGSGNEQIRCELHTANLYEPPFYEALSYVWGDPNITISVLLNGIEFTVTKNLAAAIKRLRKLNEKRVIWIDALCINQTDNDEKNIQVKVMGEIYENCANCAIWLGEQPDPPPESSEPLPWLVNHSTQELETILDDPRVGTDPVFAAFVIIYMTSKGLHTYENPCFTYCSEGRGEVELDPRLKIGEQGLELIANNDWWTRIWTVQEAILPAKCTVIFGALHAPWEMFGSTALQRNKHIDHVCCDYVNVRTDLDGHLFQLSQNFVEIELIRLNREKGGMYSIENLLMQFHKRKATNGLDMVFALIGLIPPGSVDSVIVPNYDTTIEELYSKVASHLISTLESSWVLEACKVNESGLPSWVVDWRDQISQQGSIVANWRLLRIFRNEEYEVQRTQIFAKMVTSNTINLRGFKICSIIACSREIDLKYLEQSGVPTCQEVVHLMGSEWTPEELYLDDRTWREAYWKTLIGDLVEDFRDGSIKLVRADREDFEGVYHDWWSFYMKGFNFSEPKKGADVFTYNASASIMSHDRRFYVTDNKLLGTGPLEILPGDEVYVLAGFRIPFVLRRCKEQRQGLGVDYPQFTLIGGCYTHGIMFGELEIQEEEYEDLILV